jgi:hypothetical protein
VGCDGLKKDAVATQKWLPDDVRGLESREASSLASTSRLQNDTLI